MIVSNLTDELARRDEGELTLDISSFEGLVSCIWIVIAGLGFILNLIQIVWIIRQNRRSVIDVFIVSLAMVDLLTCCVNIPLEVVELTGRYGWFGNKANIACGFYWFFRHESVVCSSIIICLIAVSRYIAISHPMRKAKEKCTQMCINVFLAVLTWIITISLVTPLVYSTASVTTHTQLTSTAAGNGTAVRVRCTQKQSGLGVVIYGSVLFFVAPALIMSISYISLIRILIKRKRNQLLAYKGNTKHFRKSIVNSVLGLAYILLASPKGVYDILQIPRAATPKSMTAEQAAVETVLNMVATLVVISNPVIYSFLTPRFFKFVEVHSQRIHDSLDHHKDFYVIGSTIDWDNRKQHRASLRRFLSHEKLTDNHKHHRHHHHHKKHMLMFCRQEHAVDVYAETAIPPKTRRQSTDVTLELDVEELIPDNTKSQEAEAVILNQNIEDINNNTVNIRETSPLPKLSVTLGNLIDLQQETSKYRHLTL